MENSNQIFKITSFREILLTELQNRQKKNPNYSMRAFARDLGMKQSSLFDVLSGRIGMSVKTALKVTENFGFNPVEKQYFCDLVARHHSRSKLQRQLAEDRLKKIWSSIDQKIISDSQIQYISKWYYPVILEIAGLYQGQVDITTISKHLNLDLKEIKHAVLALQKLGLLNVEGTKVSVAINYYKIEKTIPSDVIRSFHKSTLDMAKIKIETEPLQKRKFLSTVFSVNKKDILKARQRLEELHKQFIEEFKSDQNQDAVYALNFQYYSLTEKGAE